MKSLFLVLCISISCSVLTHAAAENTVHHPAPKDPIYLQKDLWQKFKDQLPLPPSVGSDGQKKDEAELLGLQKSRTQKECADAATEVLVSLQNFYGKPQGSLDEVTVQRLAPFFEQIRNDADFYIQQFKKDFTRKRPFLYIDGLEPCVAKEVTGAYPSGHATLSKLYALILSELFPKQKKAFEDRALVIAHHRVLSGMHHPTDILAGRKLAEMIYPELKKSERFRQDLQKLRSTH